MTKNVGKLDRNVRLVAGILLVLLALFSGMALFDGGLMKIISILVGIVLIGTAVVNFCPLYRVLGMNTCKV